MNRRSFLKVVVAASAALVSPINVAGGQMLGGGGVTSKQAIDLLRTTLKDLPTLGFESMHQSGRSYDVSRLFVAV